MSPFESSPLELFEKTISEPRFLEELEQREISFRGFNWQTFILKGASFDGTLLPMDNLYGRSHLYQINKLVIRPYSRGGVLQFINKDSYLSVQRFHNEWLIHSHLYRKGFPTTKPMGYAYRPQKLGFYQGLYFSESVGAKPWPTSWSLNQGEANNLVMNILTLCKWGIWSPDLNATNILKDPSAGILFIDWDRARVSAVKPEDLLASYKRRLLRSLEKLHAPLEIRSIISNITWMDPYV